GRYEVPDESIRDVGFCRNVRRRLLPTFFSVSANASGLLASIDPYTEPANTNENCSPPNQHCIPISTVFERFRNLPTANVKSNSMSRLAVGKRFLSDMVSPSMPADRFEPLSAVAETISVKRNAMTCVAPSEERTAKGSLRFRNACDDDFWSFEFGIPKTRDNHGVQYPMLTYITNNTKWRQSVRTRNHAYLSLDTKDSFIRPAIISFPNNIQENEQCSTEFIQSKDTSENIVRRPLLTTRNHAYLCVDTKDCTIRPVIVSFPNNIQENRRCSSEFIFNQAVIANEDTTADIWIRKNTRSSLVTRPAEALSSRTVNIDAVRSVAPLCQTCQLLEGYKRVCKEWDERLLPCALSSVKRRERKCEKDVQ
ncbi:hypothetical protein Tco_0291883, partial [Tanacetum coccineum]